MTTPFAAQDVAGTTSRFTAHMYPRGAKARGPATRSNLRLGVALAECVGGLGVALAHW